jgi:hypothetical protein
MIAYAGTYVIKDSQVINHVDVSWNETWTGTDQFRTFSFDGERLHLSTSPSLNPLTGQAQRPDLELGKNKVIDEKWWRHVALSLTNRVRAA